MDESATGSVNFFLDRAPPPPLWQHRGPVPVYRFEQQRRDYTDLAAGRVLRGAPGATAFPVRLASELAQRAFAHAPSSGALLLYDPCCGGGYLLTVIGLLHGARVRGLVGSDVSPEAVSLCESNLALLDPDGLRERLGRLEQDATSFGKDAHREAVASAGRLSALLQPQAPLRRTFVADAGDPEAIRAGLDGLGPDIAIVDVPYGRASAWAGRATGTGALLASLAAALRPGAIVAVAASKRDRPESDRFERLEHWQVGKRALAVLRLR